MKTMVKSQKHSIKKLVPTMSTKEVVTIPIAPSQLLRRKLRYLNVSYNVFKPSQSSYFSTLKPKPSWNETLNNSSGLA